MSFSFWEEEGYPKHMGNTEQLKALVRGCTGKTLFHGVPVTWHRGGEHFLQGASDTVMFTAFSWRARTL